MKQKRSFPEVAAMLLAFAPRLYKQPLQWLSHFRPSELSQQRPP